MFLLKKENILLKEKMF